MQFVGFDTYIHKTITQLKIKKTSLTPQLPDSVSGPSLLPTPRPRQTLMCARSLQETWHFSGGFHMNRMMHCVRVYLCLAWLLCLATDAPRYHRADARIDGSLLPAPSNGPKSAQTPRMDVQPL